MTTEISVMYGSEKVNKTENNAVRIAKSYDDGRCT